MRKCEIAPKIKDLNSLCGEQPHTAADRVGRRSLMTCTRHASRVLFGLFAAPGPQSHRTSLEAHTTSLPAQPLLNQLESVIDSVETEFRQWTKHNHTLRRLCAIT